MSNQQDQIIAERDRRIMELTGYAERLERERDGAVALVEEKTLALCNARSALLCTYQGLPAKTYLDAIFNARMRLDFAIASTLSYAEALDRVEARAKIAALEEMAEKLDPWHHHVAARIRLEAAALKDNAKG